jgi:hypothetical protein
MTGSKHVTAKTLVLLVLIASLSTSLFAQYWYSPMPPTSASGPFVWWGCGGYDGSNPAGPDLPDSCAVDAQAAYGGIGPYCAHNWNGGSWSDACFSYYYTSAPPSPPVGGCPGDCTGGGPVSLSNGNVYIQETDVRIPGLGNGLTLTRTWNSTWLEYGPTIGMFGTQWLSTYEEQVFLGDDQTMKYSRADGSVWSFAFYGNPQVYHLIAPGNVQPATLTEQGTTSWTVTFQNGEKRVFNNLGTIGTSNGGPLSAIIDRNGNTTSLTYTPFGQGYFVNYLLTTVTDPAGRHLYFTYGSSDYPSLVTAVSSDPGSGVNVTYAYGTTGAGQLSYEVLTQVTKADNTFVTFTYNVLSPMITSVNDTNGKVLESHNYPFSGCNAGLSSSRANGVEALTISFFSNFLYYCSPLGVGTP